ncbi:MAG: protein kinase, partial [Rhodobacteraceae bacterium]|nr:protein kinase [Paracoccaceae bacterium]
RVVAIKALNSQFSGNADYVELMKREEEMRNILHDAVVRYTDCSRTDAGAVILVMDFIDGPSLNDQMLGGRVDPRDLMIVAHRVAEGLVVTHRHGIVHRDLSPDNIILRGGKPEQATIIDFGDLSPDNIILRGAKPEQATIIDFGIAKDTSAGARTIVGNDFAGKYEYAAPEQLEGRADARTDLYSLGATLLAAYRREVPFPGATPGEIVRRKQQRIDTSGVPEPLKGVIDWLTDPDPAGRPQSAEDVVARLDDALRPATGRSKARGPATPRGTTARTRGAPPPRSGGGGWTWAAALVLALGVGAGGAWYAGLLDPFLVEPLPVASPYTLTASHDPGAPAALSTHAPTVEAGEEILRAYAQVTGRTVDPLAVTLADGMPVPIWPEVAVGLMEELRTLERWTLTLEDLTAEVAGLAVSAPERDRLVGQMRVWAQGNGVNLVTAIAAGPEKLPSTTVQGLIDTFETCGPLTQAIAPGGIYDLGDEIVVRGDVVGSGDVEAVQAALPGIAGDRPVRVELTVLNEQLCAIRAVMPDTPPSALSVWLGDGATSQPNLTGVFTTGQNPVVEVHAPEGADGTLWVMVVDTDGKVFNVLPNINWTDNRLANIGTVQGGVRRVRVLWSVDEFRADPSRMAFRIEDTNYGKSEVIAILTRGDLFDMRRPRDESVASLAEALAAALEGREAEILGVASRIIDARP